MISRKDNKVFYSKNNENMMLTGKNKADKKKQEESMKDKKLPMPPMSDLRRETQFYAESKKADEAEQTKEKEPEIVKFKIKQILHENLTGTTFHSIGYILTTPDYFLKIALSVCFLASAVYCGYVLVQSFFQFFSFGVLTTTNVVSEIPPECEFNLTLFKKHERISLFFKLKFIIKSSGGRHLQSQPV
jgi:hypothetical protein